MFILDEYELPEPDFKQLTTYFKNDYVPKYARFSAWKVMKFIGKIPKFDQELIKQSKVLSALLEKSSATSLDSETKQKILNLVKILIPMIKPYKPLPHHNSWVLGHDRI